ncbi:MAG: type I-G CRISPR-associated helicase/endonuclease Cas3g [Desulfobacterales bacterium]
MISYQDYFKKLSSHAQPHQWQIDLAAGEDCENRLVRIPTGFGKTLGVLGGWLWHRLIHERNNWPRRLAWCLPMRVLVEQTEQQVRKSLLAMGLLWDGGIHDGKVGVHLLMGGADSGEWHLYPEHPAVLIGTQDMLLSRAMNRGYASPRARWPMEFGLLNHDCLWVMDEVQLMDVALATSAQLQAFRSDEDSAGRSLRPCYTWWMSATLQSDWLKKSPDTIEMAAKLAPISLPAQDRAGHLWDDVRKPCRLEKVKDARELAQLIFNEHQNAGFGITGPTLAVVNTVDKALRVYEALCKDKTLKSKNTDIRLVHSRFRPAERSAWRGEFLNREACAPGTNRIIVATQVVEAGVDISARVLITELAPWASLVQRFGRCARWGGTASIIVADMPAGHANAVLEQAKNKRNKEISAGKKPKTLDEQEIIKAAEAKTAKPYGLDEVRAARAAFAHLSDAAPLNLEAFEKTHTYLLARLYPFEPRHLLLRHDLEELFDTTTDLSGADIDISRFIRSGEERDLHVFWADVPEKSTPTAQLRPMREAMCAVPFLKAREWLCGKETNTTKASSLKKGMQAWVWDWLDGRWRTAQRLDLYPGQTVLVEAGCGGYNAEKGWTPDSTEEVTPVALEEPGLDELADASQDSESLSATQWLTIAVHGRQTGALAKEIAQVLAPSHADLFELAGRWHDAGKVHPAFNNSIKCENRPPRRDLAKAPKEAWLPVSRLYPMGDGQRRAGFRHELASALALLEVLKRHNTDHPALLGPWRALLIDAGMAPQTASSPAVRPNPLEQEILDLNAAHFNLAAYLICAHHGKVRLAWHACPADQTAGDDLPRIRGLRDGDLLPPLPLAASDRTFHVLPQTCIDLAPAAAGLSPHTGPSWTERVLALLAAHGPFTLAWLEALLRAADQRSSRTPVQDELLEPEVMS